MLGRGPIVHMSNALPPLVEDYERYAETLAGFHVIAFIGYMLKDAADLMNGA
jgi:hypothetical protein